MSKSEQCPNDTIVNMITNLRPTLKRPLSSTGSTDDDFATPTKKLKDMPSLDITYVGSPREFRRLRSDLLSSRSTILSLENRIHHMHTIRKELEIMFESERSTLKQEVERDRKSIAELEAQLQSIRKRELELKDRLAEDNQKYTTLKLTTDQKIEDLEKKLCDLSTDKKVNDDHKSSKIEELKRKVSELEYLFNAAKDDAEAQKKLAADLDKQLSEQKSIDRNFELKEQALQKAQLRIKELEFERESYKEFQSQQRKLLMCGEIEKENVKLKEETKKLKNEVYNKLILEEEVHDLKSRLVKYREQEKTLSALQVMQSQFEMQLTEWRTVALGICGDSSTSDTALPRLLRGIVERLQQQEITLMSEKVELESQLSTAVHEAKVAKAELDKNQKHIVDMQTNIQQSQNLIHRMKKKLLLVSRERDSYRNQLDSYERDLTVVVNPANIANPGANQLQTQKERIQDLEKLVESYRDVIEKLENDLQNAEPMPHSDVVPIRMEQVARLQEEVDKLRSENELMRSRKDELEIRLEELLIGRDSPQGRVVHLEKNPFNDLVAERENELEKLQEEVIKLRRKVKDYEEGAEVSKLGDVSVCAKDIQTYKDQLKKAQENTDKLKDYFKSSMQEFRNVIYMLLGYKIDRTNSQYRLTSMYAETAEDNLCFQLNSNGTLNLMENEFSSSLESMVQEYLRVQESIPLFLSALTIDLFNTKTTNKTYEVE